MKVERCYNNDLTGYEKKLKELCKNIRDAESVCDGLILLVKFLDEQDKIYTIN
jgi:hypothetical protein